MKTPAKWAHWAAIVFLVGGPLAGLVAPETSGQFLLSFVIGAVAMIVAELHAGGFDEIMDDLAGDVE